VPESRRMKLIALCTPSLGKVSIHWTSAMMELIWPMNTGRVVLFVVGEDVAEGRNHCVTLGLNCENEEREVTHFFWVDDDVLLHKMSLMQLMSHQRDIASGVYFKKETGEPLIFPGPGSGTYPYIPDQLLEVWGHGMGLTLVRAEVYKRMRAELNLPKDSRGFTQWYKSAPPSEGAYVSGAFWRGGTEDLYFLHQAGMLGYKPLVDCSRKCFGWHFDMETRKGYPAAQFDQYLRGESPVWNTPKGPMKWRD
jgi:hypothetical protein